MMWWKNILALLIAPMGAPVSFTIWINLSMDPRSLNGILYSLPRLVRSTVPTAYTAALLLGLPAILILSHRRCLTLPVIVTVGTLIGTITGLFMGFRIASYNISEMVDYLAFDFMSIYAPTSISGMVCSSIYWAILNFNLRGKKFKKNKG